MALILRLACPTRINGLRPWFPRRLPSLRSTVPTRKVAQFGTTLGLLGLIPVSRANTSISPEKNRLIGSNPDLRPINDTRFPWRQFLAMLWPHLKYLLAAIGSALAVAYLNIQIPQQLGQVVNVVSSLLSQVGDAEGQVRRFMDQIREPCGRIIQLYLGQAVMTWGYIYSLACLGERVAADLRQQLFASIVAQDIAFFDEHKSGEIISRLTTDVQDFKSAFKLCISQGLRSTAQTVGCVVALYSISPPLTGLMLAVVPVVIGIGTALGSVLRKMSKAAQAQVAKATAVGEECISNMRTVRAFAMEDQERAMFNEEVENARRLNERLGLGIGIFQGGANLFLNGIVLTTLYYGGYLLSTQQLTAGDLMSFLVATQTIQRSLGQMSLLFGQMVKGLSAGTRIFDYVNLVPTIRLEGGQEIPYHSLIGEIEFRNVGFQYPTRPDQRVLDQFSLRIPGGKMVALVGSSGGGKSTVASLLERFYDCNEGVITVDGVDIRKLNPKWLRGRAIGYINQEPVLFATSVMENIRYGRPSATDFEVMEAARAANAHTFIQGFPDKYDTVLGERGVTVSGGQKQRIAIARALLKNPTILVLDEATSALDAESEKVVQEAIDQVAQGRTVLVIAHRLSTIQKADAIAVVDQGRIVELGTHESLKKFGGIYAKLIRQQEQSSSPNSRGMA
uniref:Mitochondrial potassium channel ATP-binding subunit n=1 Tax=Tigriopus japonicus TaxID=158387 RepID=A0A0A7ARK3_TIGJA|nr:ATP-binding cassette transporter sub-family B member 8 [Tigriopus japonicus]